VPTPGSAARARRRATLGASLLVTGVALSSAAWVLADELKRLADPGAGAVLAWAEQFHHPDQAALLPYAASALAAFAWGLYLYVRLRPPATGELRRLALAASARHPGLLAALAAAQAVLVLPGLPRALRAALAVASVLACVVRAPRGSGAPGPFARAWGAARAGLARRQTTAATVLAAAAATALVVAVSVEPVRLALGPVRLLNEYAYLPERTAATLGGEVLTGHDAAGSRCAFAYSNPLEFGLQSKSRGQMNHLGHVVNPLSEVGAGKPIAETYFQYGLGATWVFKWAMDLAGGLSVQAYYRSLLLFVAYALVYMGTAIVLFRDARYVLAAAGLLAASHYLLGYEALLLAPGINPALHLLDLPVLLAARRHFRTGGQGALLLAALGAAASVVLNPFFGGVVAIALCVAAGMRALETSPPGMRTRRLAASAALVAAPLATVAAVVPRTGGGVRELFIAGYFSWRPSPALVLFTLAWLAASYLFLAWARRRCDPEKYVLVYVFVYAQGFLAYYYWSGLASHFWPALPYVGLHVLLMLRGLSAAPRAARWEPRLLAVVLVVLAVLIDAGVGGFVAQRNAVKRVFSDFEAHRWPFVRAAVLATGDPRPVAASLAQIERYSPDERGVAVISVFDGLLPFLAARHSVFPHFELQWSLVTEEDRARAVEALARARPRHLFVGREVEGESPLPTGGCRGAMAPEVESARGRIDELRRVLDAVASDYERVETGPLLSVYRRRADRP
jgi:hypothetical protein